MSGPSGRDEWEDVRVSAPATDLRVDLHRAGYYPELVARVAVLADDLPELRSLELNPVVVSERGAVVLGARASVAHADRADATRRLSST